MKKAAGAETLSLIEGVRQGDPRAIARAISALEDREPGADKIIPELFPATGRAVLLGVTGAPGSGKSSLVNRLALHYRARGKSVGIIAVGIAQGAFEAALRYAKERRQFGQPIAGFQAIQWKLANMKMEIEAARLLVFQAAARADQGEPDTKLSSMAKLYASEMAVRATNEAVQIHGGYGFIKDYPVEKFYRDVKLCTIGEGTSEVQRLIIARKVLGKGPKA